MHSWSACPLPCQETTPDPFSLPLCCVFRWKKFQELFSILKPDKTGGSSSNPLPLYWVYVAYPIQYPDAILFISAPCGYGPPASVTAPPASTLITNPQSGS